MTQPIEILPAIALRGTTILPDMIVHFDISREKSIKAVEAAMVKDQRVFLITQKDSETENRTSGDRCEHSGNIRTRTFARGGACQKHFSGYDP